MLELLMLSVDPREGHPVVRLKVTKCIARENGFVCFIYRETWHSFACITCMISPSSDLFSARDANEEGYRPISLTIVWI